MLLLLLGLVTEKIKRLTTQIPRNANIAYNGLTARFQMDDRLIVAYNASRQSKGLCFRGLSSIQSIIMACKPHSLSKIQQERPNFVKIEPLPRHQTQTIWDEELELDEASLSCSSILVPPANRKFTAQKIGMNASIRKAEPHVQWWGSPKLYPYYTEYDRL